MSKNTSAESKRAGADSEPVRNAEHHPEGGWRSGLARAGLAISAVGIFATSLAVKIITLDPLGLATDVANAVSLGAKALGLDKAIAATGERLRKSPALRTMDKATRSVGMALSTQPFVTIAKALGVVAAIATAATPLGWAIAGISAAALAVNIGINCVKAGRTERFHQEAKKAEALADSKFEPAKGSELAKFLETKLQEAQSPEFNTKKIAADVGRLSFLDSAAAVASSIAIDGPIAGVAVGAAMVAGTFDAANDSITQKIEENEHRIARDRAMARVICARLAQEKVAPEAFASKYREYEAEEYAKNFPSSFPEKTGLKKVAQVIKDAGHGFVPFMTGGITKIKNFLFKKEEAAVERGASVQTESGLPAQGRQHAQAKTQDKAAQIPTHIEVEVGRSESLPPAQSKPAHIASAPSTTDHHHVLDPHFMETHTHIDKNEHYPNLSEGGGRAVVRKATAR